MDGAIRYLIQVPAHQFVLLVFEGMLYFQMAQSQPGNNRFPKMQERIHQV